VPAASELLGRFGDEARLYAGGTELLLVMKAGLLSPGHLIDLKTIPDFGAVSEDAESGELRIGAGATHRQLEGSPLIRKRFPALARLEHDVANVRVRNCGTLGGNLCFAEPHADPGTLLLVYEAQAQVERVDGRRRLPLDELLLGAFEVALEPDEVLSRIDLPDLPAGSAAAYRRFVSLERPSVGVAACLTPTADGAGILEARIAVGCVGPRPVRVPEAEQRLRGLALAGLSDALEEVGEIAGRSIEVIEDRAGPEAYKRHLVKVLLWRAVQAAQADLDGERAA
jgi:carbon-monoxide dehydrogenase medium subunit